MINSFDIAFIGEGGSYELNGCTVFPSKEQIEDLFSTLDDVGVGKVTKIVIDNIK